jgi:hypothetical protein
MTKQQFDAPAESLQQGVCDNDFQAPNHQGGRPEMDGILLPFCYPNLCDWIKQNGVRWGVAVRFIQ